MGPGEFGAAAKGIIAWLCRSTVSLSDLWRPMKKHNAAARPITAAAPTPIPAYAPAGRPLFCLGAAAPAVVVVGADVLDNVGLAEVDEG